MSILVVTDNGQKPGEGGKRLGYQVDDEYFITLRGVVVPLKFKRRKKESTIDRETVLMKAPEIDYHGLHQARGLSQGCVRCGNEPNRKVSLKTDVGWRDVVVCSSCGYEMRPYDPYSSLSFHW